jgi:alkylated DNA repair dioxygenase AlkB
MQQNELFGAEPVVLVDNAEGGIRYEPYVLDATTAERWMQRSLSNVEWSSHRRMMYDREVAVPRLLAGYRYGADTLPEPIGDAFDLVQRLVGASFNSVGLNLYRNGSDSVAFHNDKTEHLVVGAPIAILSLGQTRRMLIREKNEKRRSVSLALEAGSLLVMSYARKFSHDHGIPKEREEIGPRVSLAFRNVAPDRVDEISPPALGSC